MKVYVDEQNKEDLENLIYLANLEDCDIEMYSLADYTKQVRMEVIENLKQEIIYYPVGLLDIDGKSQINTWGISKQILETYFEKILDKLQGE